MQLRCRYGAKQSPAPATKNLEGKRRNKTKDLYPNAQSRNTQICGEASIPRTGTSTKAGTPSGTEISGDSAKQQVNIDPKKRKREPEKEHAILQADIDRRLAEAERDLFRTTLEQERLQMAGILEQVKLQGELLKKLFLRPVKGTAEGRITTGSQPGFVSELVGFHAVKRVAADITRSISATVGLGNDVRILIVDRPDYAFGDIPYIDIISQLSVFEVRCRKQVATNRELADLVMTEVEEGEDERTLSLKAGTTRLAPLTAAPPVLPETATAVTGMPAAAGILGTPADTTDFIGSGYYPQNHGISQKTDGLIAAVAGSLRSEKRYVYVYNFYSMDTTGPQSKLMNMYAGMLDCSSRLAQSRNRLLYFVSKKTGRLDELRSSLHKALDGEQAGSEQAIPDLAGEIRKEAAWLDRATSEVLSSDALHAELGSFVKNITASETGQPGSRLARAVVREKVHELGITHLLYLDVLESGGESVTRKGLLGSGSVSYMGGAVVGYVLSRIEGEVLVSDTLPVLFSFEFDPSGQRHSPLKPVRFDKQEQKK